MSIFSSFKSGLKFLDTHLESFIMIPCYIVMSAIIFVEVLRRFVLHQQAPWSTQVPTYLFLIIVWIGCAQCVKNRSHLSFSEIRTRLPRSCQFIALLLDYIVWLILFFVVFHYSWEQAMMTKDGFATVFGTDVEVWYFYLAVPAGWVLLIFRATQNFIIDCKHFICGEPLISIQTDDGGTEQ